MRRDALRVMLECSDRIERYTRGLSLAQFAASRSLQDAVANNVRRLANASREIPIPLKRRYRDADWARLILLRRALREDYMDDHSEAMWRWSRTDLPRLKIAVEAISEPPA